MMAKLRTAGLATALVTAIALVSTGWAGSGDERSGRQAALGAQTPAAIPGTNLLTTLDSAGFVGRYTSLTIGADGLGLVSYYDATNGNLKIAHCANAACSSASLATLDSAGDVGRYTSVTIGADGLGLVSYYDLTNGNLKLAHCANVVCSSASLAGTYDSAGDVGSFTSVTIGADGLGLVSYYDATNGNLKVAHCANAACSSASLRTLDSAGTVGINTSVTIGADGLGLVSYLDYTNANLKVAHCANVVCSSASLRTLESAGTVGVFGDGPYTSVTIGADGLGLVSYYTTQLKVAHCANAFCVPYFQRR